MATTTDYARVKNYDEEEKKMKPSILLVTFLFPLICILFIIIIAIFLHYFFKPKPDIIPVENEDGSVELRVRSETRR
ncbi:unnamed protein product [Cochlearia groenlandica]